MSNLSQGPIVRQRGKGYVGTAPGILAPEVLIPFASVAAPGVVGVRLFVAPKRCKVVRIDETHTTVGAGSSKISIRKHLAAHVAAPDAALATTNITSVAEISADATANTRQSATLVAANTSLAAGDKLMAVFPATVAGVGIQVWVVYS